MLILAILYFTLNNALAQPIPPVSPPVSASASADKAIGYGQITKDGRKYENLTEKEVDGLSDAEYDTYQKWKIAQKKATIIAIQEETQNTRAEIIAIQEETQNTRVEIIAIQKDSRNLQATLIATYSSYFDTFSKLHALK